MKKMIFVCLLVMGFVATANAQDPAAPPAPVQSFKAGGVAIAIPPPVPDMREVGYDNREFMEVIVPAVNRLIAGFVLEKDLPKIRRGSDRMMTKYALVEVPRRGEYLDCSAANFKEVTAGVKRQFGDVLSSSVKKVEDEFNQRMKSLHLDQARLSIGKPISLGCLFSKPDAYAFGMVSSFSMGGKTAKMVMGCCMLRARQKILFAYLYAQYKDKSTIQWIRQTSESWADAILKANQSPAK